MPNKPIRPTSDDTFQVSPAIRSATIPPTKGDRNGPENHGRLDRRAERDQQQYEHAEQCHPNRQRQGARCASLTLDPSREIEEISSWQFQAGGQQFPHLRSRAAQIPPGDRRLDGNSPGSGFAPDRRRSEGLRDLGELPERNLPAVVAVNEKRANRVEAVATIVAQADYEIETTLAKPDLRLLFPNQTDSDSPDYVPWRQAHARGGVTVDGNLQLRKACELFGAEVGNAVDAANELLRLVGQPRELVEIRTEDPDREIGRRPAQAFVDPHAQRRREQNRDARHPFEPLTHVCFNRFDIP
jgi:hypothetical protein